MRAFTSSSILAASLLAAGLASGLTGCSSSSSGKASNSDGGAGGSGNPSCDLVSASEVESNLGLSGVQAPQSEVNGPVTLCSYMATSAVVEVRFETGYNMADYQQGEQGFTSNGETTTALSGLGDAAYTSTLGTGSSAVNTVVTLQGSVEVEVSAAASLTDVEALAREILTRL